MERRKILLGSGSIIAIALAGCTSVSSDQEAGRDGNSESNGRDETDDGGEKKDSRKDNGNNDNTETMKTTSTRTRTTSTKTFLDSIERPSKSTVRSSK